MNLPGLILIKPEDTADITSLSNMAGESFLEELWTDAWLSALDEIGTSAARKLEISQAIIKSNFTVGAPYQCVYALEDNSAVAGGYLASDLKGKRWIELEDQSFEHLCKRVLSIEEVRVLSDRFEKMKAISNFTWMYEDASTADFIHFFAIAVDVNKRGSGAFRRLLTPFLEYASTQKINCYLECYSEKTEAAYSHLGFELVKTYNDPAFQTYERCMIKHP